MMHFNCVTLANFEEISLLDSRNSSILVIDNQTMTELAQFEFINDKSQYFYSAYYHQANNMLYLCFDRGLIKQFQLNVPALRRGDKCQGLLWKCDFQIDKNNSITKFVKFSDQFILGLAEQGIIYVFNLTKSAVNRPYPLKIPNFKENILDLKALENNKENKFFVCTKNGLFLFKIYLKQKNLMIEVLNQGEQEEEEEEFAIKGFLPDDTVKAAV